MKKRNIIFMVYAMFLTISFTSCKDYLQVDPKSTVSDKELFTSEAGFKQALIGIYAQAASRPLFGDNLSMGFVSALGSNYSTTAVNFIFKETTALNYTAVEVQNYSNAIWRTSYNAIAGLNNILSSIDDKEALFSEGNYAQVKAEALGLRAYLHFELLRLYGAAYATGADSKSIPYRKSINSLSQTPATVKEVMNLVLEDLMQSEELIKNIEPMVVNGDLNRRYYFNYYAAKALEARVYMYMGDKAKAAAAAKIVVESGKFTYRSTNDPYHISTAATSRDRVFSTELVFALRVFNMSDWTEAAVTSGYFRLSGSALDASDLTLSAANLNTLFEVNAGGSTDYRNVYLTDFDVSIKYPSKFWQTQTLDVNLRNIMPMIRLSEMYYILAECAPVLADGLANLNIVRKNRGIAELPLSGMTDLKLTDEITKEHQKEFFAEGQLFYYYKRKGFTKMLFNAKTLTPSDYTLPIPEAELEFNPTYK